MGRGCVENLIQVALCRGRHLPRIKRGLRSGLSVDRAARRKPSAELVDESISCSPLWAARACTRRPARLKCCAESSLALRLLGGHLMRHIATSIDPIASYRLRREHRQHASRCRHAPRGQHQIRKRARRVPGKGQEWWVYTSGCSRQPLPRRARLSRYRTA